jgi:hypothetical protein
VKPVFSGARAVIEASRCALDREYSKRDHAVCAWCQYAPGDLIKEVWSWMKDPANGQEIAKEDRGEVELW